MKESRRARRRVLWLVAMSGIMLILLPGLFCAGSTLLLNNNIAVRLGNYTVIAYPNFDSTAYISTDGSQGFGIGAPCPTDRYTEAWEKEVANTGIVIWRCMDISELVAPAYAPPGSNQTQTR